MPQIKVTKVEIDEAALEGALEKIISDLAELIFEVADENIDDFNIYDTGALSDSGRIEYIGVGARKIVWDVPYAIWVEFGGTHEVDEEKLHAWVKRKLKLDDPYAKTVAKRIKTQIERFGQEPRRFATSAIERTRQILE